jgi:nucleoside phosphorylase
LRRARRSARIVRLAIAALLLLSRLLPACEPPVTAAPLDGLCATVTARCTPGPYVVILSAFPAEQSVLRFTTEVSETLEIAGHSVLVGRLGGRPVVLSLTGIGLVNATNVTSALVTQFDVSHVLFSGVAGSRLRIGDVVVPATWTDVARGETFGVDSALLDLAATIAAAPPALGRCTPVPPVPPGAEVCMPHDPAVTIGGSGESADPFNGMPFPCTPGEGEVFGCQARAAAAMPQQEGITVDAVDMESAAVAAVAAAHGIPFLAVRGVSDGAGDPLGLRGAFQQFFAYYRLAADNAAAVMLRLVEALPVAPAPAARLLRLHTAAACGFARAAAIECGATQTPARATKLVTQACGSHARLGDAPAARARRLAKRAASRWTRAANLIDRSKLPACCATALASKLRAAATEATPID